MQTNRLGKLAYYDSISGLIPCKVFNVTGEYITFEITATRGAYKRNEVLYSIPRNVIPRKMVHVRNGQYRIKTGYQWIQDETGIYAIETTNQA